MMSAPNLSPSIIYSKSSEYLIECYKSYIQNNYILQPLKPISHTPKYKRWQDSIKSAELDELGSAAAVVLQNDDLVIDADPRRYVNGVNSLNRLWKDLQLPNPINTFIVKTGRGGFHLYFKKPVSLELPSKKELKDYPGLEIKRKGHYLVAAGTLHRLNKNPYTIERLGPNKVLLAPDDLIELIQSNGRTLKSIADKPEDNEIETEGTRNLVIQYLIRTIPAIEGEAGNDTTFTTARQCLLYGVSKETAYNLMLEYFNPRCTPEWTAEDLFKIVDNAYTYKDNTEQGSKNAKILFKDLPTRIANKYHVSWDHIMRPDGKNESGETVFKMQLLPTSSNMYNYFVLETINPIGKGPTKNPLLDLVQFNLFSNQIEFRKPAPWHNQINPISYWRDEDGPMMKLWLEKTLGFYVPTTKITETLQAIAHLYEHHPVKYYLENLKWDEQARLDTWLEMYCGAPDNIYVRQVGAKSLISAVARIMTPGVQNDSILVLEGEQGIGKSSLCRILGGAWSAEIIIDPKNAKETVGDMQGAWIIEAAEMEFVKKADVQSMKAFMTRGTDKVRLPYDRFAKILPRNCVFIGTINPSADNKYLHDATGNRRFWPIAIKDVNMELLKQDRDQLFAEAYYRFKQGERHYITDVRVKKIAQEETAKRTSGEAWQDIIENWINTTSLKTNKIKMVDIAVDVLGLSAQLYNRHSQSRISQALKNLGYEPKLGRNPVNQAVERYWVKETDIRSIF